CGPDEAFAFLDDWRADRANEWPGYVKWLSAQYRHRTAAQPEREAVGGKMLNVARRNLCTFIGLASFKSENDREAALNCLEVIEAELSGLNDLVAVLRSALAADAALTTPAPAVGILPGDVPPSATLPDPLAA